MGRKLDVSNASATVVQPVKAGTLTFLQAAWAAGLNDICAALLGIDSTTTATTAYVLYGCVGNITGTTPATITAGAIIFNGEIYEVPASTITYGGGQVAICNIVTTPDTPDPTTFSNQIQYQVHNIRTIVISAGTSGAGTVCDFGALVYNLKSVPQILTQVVDNDLTLQGNINAEVNRAESAEYGLQTQITAIGEVWTSASPPTLTGATLGSTANFSYCIIGKTMFLSWDFSAGVSSATSFKVTLPASATTGALCNGDNLSYTSNSAYVVRAVVSPGNTYFTISALDGTTNLASSTSTLYRGTLTIQIV